MKTLSAHTDDKAHVERARARAQGKGDLSPASPANATLEAESVGNTTPYSCGGLRGGLPESSAASPAVARDTELVRLTPQELDETVGEPPQPRLVPTRPALGLTEVERRSVEEMVTGLPYGETAAFVAQRAAALASDTDGSVRRRSLSKALAIQEALMAQLSTLLAAAVANRDSSAVSLLDRALNGATARFRLLSDELRADYAGNKKANVQVQVVAGTVNVNGGR